MLKKMIVATLILAIVAVVALSAYAPAQAAAGDVFIGRGRGGRGPGSGQAGSGYALPAASELSPAEASDLLFMREEEKLARDVYTELYEKWGLPVFQTISQSEQQHMDSLKTLLDRYGLEDPAQAQAGVFTDPGLQALYNELVARGSQSLAEALKVGGLIEEVDIADLQTRLAQTDNADIQQVYNRLMLASYNHLRAFSRTLLAQTGETYQPQQLSAEAYQTAGSTTPGRSGQGRSGSGRGW